MWARFGDAFAVVFIVAIVYVLVRPRSKAGDLVEAVADLIIALVRGATDLARAPVS